MLWFFFLLNVKVRNVPFRSIWECMLFFKAAHFADTFLSYPIPPSQKIISFLLENVFYPNNYRLVFETSNRWILTFQQFLVWKQRFRQPNNHIRRIYLTNPRVALTQIFLIKGDFFTHFYKLYWSFLLDMTSSRNTFCSRIHIHWH